MKIRMNRKGMLMIITACLMLCGSVYGGELRVLTYNIHSGKGMDGKLDLPRIAEVIKSFDPDIVSLQEVDKLTTRSGKIDQTAELARLTGMHFIFGASLKRWGGEYGNAVLSKFPIKKMNIIPLPGEPRSALCVNVNLSSLDGGPKELVFVATHLDVKREPRLEALPMLEKGVSVYTTLPMILAGDLNATPDSQAMDFLQKKWKVTTADKSLVTIPGRRKWPAAQIDYVLYRSEANWEVIENRVVEDMMASDHFPLLSVLKYRGK